MITRHFIQIKLCYKFTSQFETGLHAVELSFIELIFCTVHNWTANYNNGILLNGNSMNHHGERCKHLVLRAACTQHINYIAMLETQLKPVLFVQNTCS